VNTAQRPGEERAACSACAGSPPSHMAPIARHLLRPWRALYYRALELRACFRLPIAATDLSCCASSYACKRNLTTTPAAAYKRARMTARPSGAAGATPLRRSDGDLTCWTVRAFIKYPAGINQPIWNLAQTSPRVYSGILSLSPVCRSRAWPLAGLSCRAPGDMKSRVLLRRRSAVAALSTAL